MQISRVPVFTLPLKSAIVAGAITISSTVGIFTIVANREEIFKSLNYRYEQIKDFYQNTMLPPLITHFNALSFFFHKYEEWYLYLKKNREEIKKILDIRNFPEAYRKMGNKIYEWYEWLISFLRWILLDMNELAFRSMVYKFLMFISVIPGMLTVLKNFLENLISKNLEKLPTDFPAFLMNAWTLFSENSKIIGELHKIDYNTIFNYMSDKPQEFSERIKTAKENAKKLPPGKWGRYKNKHEFLKDVLPPDKSTNLLLKRIGLAYITCAKTPSQANFSPNCWNQYTSLEDLKEFISLKSDEKNLEVLKALEGEDFEFKFPNPSPQ